MRERVDENNIDIKHLVLTNVYEWYVIDAANFDKVFYQNKKFVKDYQTWSTGQKVTSIFLRESKLAKMDKCLFIPILGKVARSIFLNLI